MSIKTEEQERHIQEMKERLFNNNGNSMDLFIKDSLPLELKEKILESILSMEEAEERPLFDFLKEEGIGLPRPDALKDSRLHDKLWEVIQAMADRNQFLYHTDHLSDRQLYETLWNDILRESVSMTPEDSGCVGYIDILGGCSDEDRVNHLKYYADEEEREAWAEEYPEDDIPDHEDPPYDRDRHLPGPRDFFS
jgi:hypothetical protein